MVRKCSEYVRIRSLRKLDGAIGARKGPTLMVRRISIIAIRFALILIWQSSIRYWKSIVALFYRGKKSTAQEFGHHRCHSHWRLRWASNSQWLKLGVSLHAAVSNVCSFRFRGHWLKFWPRFIHLRSWRHWSLGDKLEEMESLQGK
jgi:hypothetical protein